MILVLADLGQDSGGRHAAETHAVLFEAVLVGRVHLVAMAVAFGDFGCAVNLRDLAATPQRRRIRAEPHRAAEIAVSLPLLELIALEPLGHQADHWLLGR